MTHRIPTQCHKCLPKKMLPIITSGCDLIEIISQDDFYEYNLHHDGPNIYMDEIIGETFAQ